MKRFQLVVAYVHAVHEYLPVRHVVEARDEIYQRALAAPRGSDEGHCLPLPGPEADVLKDALRCPRVSEGYVPELYLALLPLGGFLHCAALDRWLCVDDLLDAPGGHSRAGDDHEDEDHHHECHDHLHGIGREDDHVGEHLQPEIGTGSGGYQYRTDYVYRQREQAHYRSHHRRHDRHDTAGE
ncbi:hypothetical protein SDC9_171816 [bioreactor metagenome]|uniref:Uncharacterized protein n=1 Tax=bioreactor metagenome TaxID=1076179 RepID=A0A645GBY2_9ZZZZ